MKHVCILKIIGLLNWQRNSKKQKDRLFRCSRNQWSTDSSSQLSVNASCVQDSSVMRFPSIPHQDILAFSQFWKEYLSYLIRYILVQNRLLLPKLITLYLLTWKWLFFQNMSTTIYLNVFSQRSYQTDWSTFRKKTFQSLNC